MELEGIVSNGVIVPDESCSLPEGTRVRIEVATDLDDELDRLTLPDPSLPPDHPDAPYDREIELAILRESIAEMKAGGGRPFEEVMAEIGNELRSLSRAKE
jgi:hypothetical protein